MAAVHGYLHVKGVVVQLDGGGVDTRQILSGEGRSCLNRGCGFFVFRWSEHDQKKNNHQETEYEKDSGIDHFFHM